MSKQKLLKILKWIGISIGGLILLITVLVFAFKKKIINYVVSEINQHLTAKVQVKKIDVTFWKTFPKVSVDFKEVLILDTLVATNDTVIYSDLIRLKFNAKDLWNKKYVLEEAQVFPGIAKLKVYRNGRENYLIYQSTDTATNTPIDLKLDKIKLYDFRLSYENKITKQYYKTQIKSLQFKGDFQADQFDLETTSDLKILAIKNQGVQLISNKSAKINVKLLINRKNNLVTLPKSEIEIEKLPFVVEGVFSSHKMQIEIDGKQLQLQDVTNHLLSNYDEVTKYQGKGIVDFHLSILDDMLKETPTWINCTFKLKNGSLNEPSQDLTLTNINVDGEYSNMKGIGKEIVQLKTFSFQSPTGPFIGQFQMTDFSAPRYIGKAVGTINLASLKQFFRVQEIDSIKGNVGLDLQFDVSTLQKGYSINQLSGNTRLLNVSVKLRDYLQSLKNINGNITFNKNDAYFDNITVLMNKSDLAINGEVNHIEEYLSRRNTLSANVQITSKYINVADLALSPSSDSTVITIGPIKDYKLPNDIIANVNVNIEQLKYREHTFSQLRSNLWVGNRRLAFSNMNVENGGSSVQGSLVIEETQPQYFMVETNLQSKGINFKKMFKEWNNFDQNVIQEQNIDGYAVVNVQFKAPFDWTTGVKKNQIVSTIGVNIVDGTLKNVNMFKTITGSLKKSAAKLLISKKQLDLFEQRLLNLKFNQLQNDFIINDGKVIIPEMQIKSSALDLNLDGWHSFNNQINYRFSFRFRDLKTVQKDTEFGVIEDDGTGFNIFMKMTGTMDNPQISWDKDAQKEHSKEQRQKAKDEALSILKSEFGIGKNNANIKDYQPQPQKQVEFEVDFGEEKDSKKEDPKKEDSKVQKEIKKAKKEKEQEVEFEIE